VNSTPESSKTKKGRKKFLLFGKRSGKADQSDSEKAAQPAAGNSAPAASYH